MSCRAYSSARSFGLVLGLLVTLSALVLPGFSVAAEPLAVAGIDQVLMAGKSGTLVIDRDDPLTGIRGRYTVGGLVVEFESAKQPGLDLASARLWLPDGTHLAETQISYAEAQVLMGEASLSIRRGEETWTGRLSDNVHESVAIAFAQIPLDLGCARWFGPAPTDPSSQILPMAALLLPWQALLREGELHATRLPHASFSRCSSFYRQRLDRQPHQGRIRLAPDHRVPSVPFVLSEWLAEWPESVNDDAGSLEAVYGFEEIEECYAYGRCENDGNGYSNDCFGCCGAGCGWVVANRCDTSQACRHHDTCYYLHGSGNPYCDLDCVARFGAGPCLDGLYGMGDQSVEVHCSSYNGCGGGGDGGGGGLYGDNGCWVRGRWCDLGWCECGGGDE